MPESRLWPRSLFGRNLLLLLGLTAIAQISIITVYVLLQRPRVMEVAQLVAAQINTLGVAMSQIPPDRLDAYVARLNKVGPLEVQRADPPPDDVSSNTPLVRLFLREIRHNLSSDIEVRWTSLPRMHLWVHVNISNQRYWIRLPINAWLHYRWLTSVLILSLCMAFSAALGALLIQRRVNRPLRDIADAARNLGAGARPERLPAYAATELAVVSRQFNAMMDHLDEMETTRAVMLAGISHDLRSPLTKLRLALAMDPHTSVLPLNQYIEQIDVIVGQFLDFGRAGSDEPVASTDLNHVIKQLAGDYRAHGHPFTLQLAPLPSLPLRPIAIMRLVHNLMENAVKYGAVGLQVRTEIDRSAVTIAVLDQGPGLAAGDETRLLQPFVRADVGRSSVSGAGLGLAIVDRIARLHGGYLQLIRRQPNGLEARVILPLNQAGPILRR